MIVRTEKELEWVLTEFGKAKYRALDTEYVAYGFPNTQLVGTSLAWADDFEGEAGIKPFYETEGYIKGAYIPINHEGGTNIPLDFILPKLKEVIETSVNPIAMHNAKADIQILSHYGINVPEDIIFDTMIAHWLINTDGVGSEAQIMVGQGRHDLKTLSKYILGYTMTELSDISPKEHGYWDNNIDKWIKTKASDKTGSDYIYRVDLVPIDKLGEYAYDDAVQTLKLMFYLSPLILQENVSNIYNDIEREFVFCLAEMEKYGAFVDGKKLQEFKDSYKVKIDSVLSDISKYWTYDTPFNPNSTKDLNKMLFEIRGIKPIGELNKKNEYTTNAACLEIWAETDECAALILKYREMIKMYGTYLVGMGGLIRSDSRLHTSFLRHGTRTGRLSSSHPNLQNIPTGDEISIRQVFVAPKGKKLVVGDLSQIELRLLAHLSGDTGMVEIYQKGKDLHSETAKAVFNLKCPVDQVKHKFPKERKKGKTVNFAVIYGIGAKRLAHQIDVTEDEAKVYIQRYFNRFPKVQDFVHKSRMGALKYGYVKTQIGRKRHLPLIKFVDEKIRKLALSKTSYADMMYVLNHYLPQNQIELVGKALRQSVNSKVQGFASDIMAIIMRNIRRKAIEQGIWGKGFMLTMQVHDELIAEVDEDKAEEYAKFVKYEMENAIKGLKVPIISDVQIADNWLEGKE